MANLDPRPGSRIDRKIIWLVAIFLLLGELMLFSASGVLALQRHGTEFYFVTRQSICAALGFGLMLILARMDYRRLSALAYPLLFLQIVLTSLTMVPSLSQHALGATRWLRLGPLAFQPSEFAKIVLVLFAARVAQESQVRPLSLKAWAVRLLPVGLLLVLILKQPDLGTTVLLSLTVLGMFFVAGMRLRTAGFLLFSAVFAFAMMMWRSDYRRRRFLTFLDPWADPQGSGFQTIQSFLSFHSGKWTGLGVGNGNSKLFFLPEVHTDFIFSLIGEELGFFGAMAVLGLFVYLSFLLFRASVQISDGFGSSVIFGLALTLVLQIAVNLGGVTGLLPLKGLPLPFLSWGRSALLVNLIAFGILLSIIRHGNYAPPRSR